MSASRSFTPEPFVPRPVLAGGHRMTLFAWARRRHFPRLPAGEARRFRIAADTEVLGHCHWQPERTRALTVILLHGLEGSSDGHYMLGLADKAWARGFNVVRLNQRNCGGTEHLTRGLYHSGLTADPLAVMRALAARRPAAIRLRRLLAGRQPGPEARRRARGRRQRPRRRRRRGVGADRAGHVRRCARTPPQPRLPLELHARAAGADAAEGAALSRGLGYRAAAAHPYRARLRRRLHRAVSRVCRRRRLLPPGQRPAGDRSAGRAGAAHHRRRRPVRAVGVGARPVAGRRDAAHPGDHHVTAGTAGTSGGQSGPTTTATGPNGR